MIIYKEYGREMEMQVVSSYAVGIEKAGRKTFAETERIYRDAVSFLIDVFSREWVLLSAISDKNERFNAAEHLVHTTKKNAAKHDFDVRFPKMPSYLRRAATEAALGAVSGYCSSLANWKKNGQKGKPPKLTCDRMVMPVFYNSAMYKPGDEPDTAYLKLHRNGDWVWVKVRLRRTDVRYLEKYWSHEKARAPILERNHGKYQLRFAFTETVKLTEKPADEQIICAVDLGLNTDAVCVIMDSQGTVAERKFIDFPAEKDLVWTVYGRIRRQTKKHGPWSIRGLWAYAKRLNTEHARKVGAAIADFAYEAGADVIVFEHLDFRGRRCRGSKAMRLTQWRKNTIQDIAEHRAHRLGLRISRICAWNTSRLAYDGSGRLTEKPADEQIICAVDLGLNTDAVCVIMDSQGTVAERKFIDFPAEKDLVWTVYGRIRRQTKKHGPWSIRGLWAYAKRLNTEHARKVGAAIADFAYEAGADVIVFEHLDFRGRRCRGSKAMRLTQWRKNTIQDIAEHRAHRLGLRISRICAWNTSRLAYDGSGRLKRDEHNRALAAFTTGKQYNADLNAAYNIGARYFVRELQKPLPETERSRLQAEVPDAGRRTCAVMQTLWLLRKAMAAPAA